MRKSAIETHPLRKDIEQCLREGMAASAVARTYDVDAQAVQRWWRKLQDKDKEQKAKLAEMSDFDRIVERLDTYTRIVEGLAKSEHGRGQYAAAGRLIEVGRKVTKDLAELKGLIKSPGITVGVQVNNGGQASPGAPANVPTAEAFKLALFKALRPFPEARDAVVAEFLKVQARHDGKPLLIEGNVDVDS